MAPPRIDKENANPKQIGTNISGGISRRMKLKQMCNEQKANTGSSRSPLKPINTPVKLELANENVDKPGEPTKLTDLNDDCFRHMLQDFPLKDLLAFGSTCKRLKEVACLVFKETFKQNEVHIDCDIFPVYKVISKSEHLHQRQFLGRDVGKFLWIFGEVVSKLVIVNMYIDRQQPIHIHTLHSIKQLISTRCHETLLNIRFDNFDAWSILMDNLQPFKNVKKVTFERSVIRNGADFEILFPEMNYISLIECSATDSGRSIQEINPNLETFNFIIPMEKTPEVTFKLENLQAAFDKNPGIKHLMLLYWNETAYDAKLLKYAAMNLKELESLRLWHLRYTDFHTEGEIIFNTVRKLTLENCWHSKLDINLSQLSFPELNQFHMIGEFNAECFTFLARHQTIKKLKIHPSGEHKFYPVDSDLIKVCQILPGLKKLTVDGRRLTANGLKKFISQRPSLVRIAIRRYNFRPVIRKLFTIQCNLLGWDVFSEPAFKERKIILKPK